MSVRAKFRVEAVTQTVNGFSVALFPVTGGSPENEKFYNYTPGGKVELTTINSDAGRQFIPGDEFYLDFTPVGEVIESGA